VIVGGRRGDNGGKVEADGVKPLGLGVRRQHVWSPEKALGAH